MGRPPADSDRDAALIAVDPGNNVGVAWLARDGRLLRAEVVDRSEFDDYAFAPGVPVVIGDGTGSAEAFARLVQRGLDVQRVDERHTSERARALYWRDHPPRGLLRLVPVGLRPPPRPLDDYAAYAIGLRALDAARGPSDDDA